MQDAHAGTEPLGQAREQRVRARQLARDRIADAHRDRRRSGGAVLHHVEVVVEGRDLVHFGHRELHLLRERDEMTGGEMAVAVLDPVQMLDEQIASPRCITEQRTHLGERRAVDSAAFRRGTDLGIADRRGHLQPVVHRELAYHAALPRRH